ncbi:SDR family NAD(P)-dependent oxidoreductase [Paenibacillus glucanolyticus]|jgi:NAD(P)-dependent dehydrogenase (short-subunit alcohol dehydrogenase family)|uniref:Short-chain dehydrogenase n=1 Tax=Paenibacillus glucanolyticus TaxID=59843 RepID=A0A163HKL0_9BACL|nr:MULTISPECIES: SDR family NAD(P)-dependent oxidoreductase [Paenibacillus]ANA79586.1 short-chain dehydrogenase [Paenibacillus glucanolyticus]AVV56464.1 SDR family NAD(P)-dependent oxidoreductase [Paenibacillus glucanolyticus]ETT31267.1 short-chain dehydrogenase/reductase SDR [Paenibacillus sp. FSL R5-808]KZS45531.1 short-chain dehydrogenase [Paenibacillus glucanolyticus]MPY19794.1 SDR family oxidoreductase [Paenibacillus glucanolyticus]
MRFQSKVVIVTGGASGIGEAAVRLFVKEGASVVIADFSDRGQAVSDELSAAGFNTLFVKTDVTKEQDVANMVEQTVKQYGRVDILFANAGIAHDAPADQLTMENWQRTIDINLTGVFLCDKYVIQQLLSQGSGGAIVNCGSIHSHVGKAGVTAYASAKGGVKLLTQSMGADYASRGIRVNAVCPGYIDTPLIQGRTEAITQHLVGLHPMGRLGQPEEVAKAVLFLASEDASFITGTTLLVDGGYTAV